MGTVLGHTGVGNVTAVDVQVAAAPLSSWLLLLRDLGHRSVDTEAVVLSPAAEPFRGDDAYLQHSVLLGQLLGTLRAMPYVHRVVWAVELSDLLERYEDATGLEAFTGAVLDALGFTFPDLSRSLLRRYGQAVTTSRFVAVRGLLHYDVALSALSNVNDPLTTVANAVESLRTQWSDRLEERVVPIDSSAVDAIIDIINGTVEGVANPDEGAAPYGGFDANAWRDRLERQLGETVHSDTEFAGASMGALSGGAERQSITGRAAELALQGGGPVSKAIGSDRGAVSGLGEAIGAAGVLAGAGGAIAGLGVASGAVGADATIAAVVVATGGPVMWVAVGLGLMAGALAGLGYAVFKTPNPEHDDGAYVPTASTEKMLAAIRQRLGNGDLGNYGKISDKNENETWVPVDSISDADVAFVDPLFDPQKAGLLVEGRGQGAELDPEKVHLIRARMRDRIIYENPAWVLSVIQTPSGAVLP